MGLQAHVAHGITPVAVAGAATDGADLELVHAAGRQAADGHAAGTGEEATALKGAWSATGADEGVTCLVGLRIVDTADAQDELAAAAVEDVLDRRRPQRDGGAVGAHGLKTAGQQLGQVIAMIFLHVTSHLTQQTGEGLTLGVLVGRIRRATLRSRSHGTAEGSHGRVQRGSGHRNDGIGRHRPEQAGVEVVMHGLALFEHGRVRGGGKAKEDAELVHTGGCGLRQKSIPGQAGRIPAQRLALSVRSVPGDGDFCHRFVCGWRVD